MTAFFCGKKARGGNLIFFLQERDLFLAFYGEQGYIKPHVKNLPFPGKQMNDSEKTHSL